MLQLSCKMNPVITNNAFYKKSSSISFPVTSAIIVGTAAFRVSLFTVIYIPGMFDLKWWIEVYLLS